MECKAEPVVTICNSFECYEPSILALRAAGATEAGIGRADVVIGSKERQTVGAGVPATTPVPSHAAN